MFDPHQMQRPIVGAPMAGGVSTPKLVAAVSEAGGLGFLAAGYADIDRLATNIAEVRALTKRDFGVNVFVPGDHLPTPDQVASLRAYAERLRPVAERSGGALDARPDGSDFDYAAKIELLAADPVAVVSFTFGLPTEQVVERLHAAGSAVWATVTTLPDADAATRLGVDALCVQGPEAGGHRATFDAAAAPGTEPLDELLRLVISRTTVPCVAAGGVGDRERVAELLDLGAAAVAVGTALMRTPEAGTSGPHRDALVDPRFQATAITRAFTGRPARSLVNGFVRSFDGQAPALYPQVHFLTGPIRRAAAAGDPDNLHLWAGTAHAQAQDRPAADIVKELCP